MYHKIVLDSADARADLIVHCSHMPEDTFSYGATQML